MLFLKECKKILLSLTYMVYLVAVIAIFVTQFGCELNEPLEEPQITDEYYGLIKTQDENIIMTSAIYSLLYEFEMNTYESYPFGFYKEVKLNQSEIEQMKQIINELTEADNLTINRSLTYEKFITSMEKVDDILGGGSQYSASGIDYNFASVPMSYEEAMAEYESITKDDELTKAYTRLFCDYLGIILGIMPVFVCAALWQADKRSGIEPLIFSRKISSVKLIGTRYLALLFTMFIPVAVTYIYTLFKLNDLYGCITTELTEAFGLMLLWLVPEMMIVISVGTIVAVLWSAFGAMFVQAIWWFMNVMVKTQLSGGITRWDLVVRHNTLSEIQLFYVKWDVFVWNRMFYLILSIALLLISVVIYSYKRKGVFHGKRMLHKNHTSESEA